MQTPLRPMPAPICAKLPSPYFVIPPLRQILSSVSARCRVAAYGPAVLALPALPRVLTVVQMQPQLPEVPAVLAVFVPEAPP